MSEKSKDTTQEKAAAKTVTRRDFITALGGVGIGAVLAGAGASAFLVHEDVYAIEASEGYLLVDSKKCASCETCMMACSLAHSGRSNVNLSRIQLTKNPFGHFPDDSVQNQCRQCPYPACVNACPTKAMHVDPDTGVRTVDEGKCIGCERCVEACPFTPSRVQWNFEEKHAQKCDLCLDTPYWSEQGGPNGKQACVAVCPMKAISFTHEIPRQNAEGYDVNLRNEHWAMIGFPIDDEGRVLPKTSVPDPSAVQESADATNVF